MIQTCQLLRYLDLRYQITPMFRITCTERQSNLRVSRVNIVYLVVSMC